MNKIGLSSCGKEINESLFEKYSKAGITAMEVSMGKEGYAIFDYKEARRLADQYGVELWSMHLPFGLLEEIDISSLDMELRKQSVEYLSKLIRQAGSAGIDKYVIHPSAEPIDDETRKDRMEAAKESLSLLSQVSVSCGGHLAVENLPRTCLGNCGADMKELISASDDLRVCFDTNHLLGEDFEVLFKEVGDKIITVHVSDYDFINERHWLPGEGKLDWKRMLACFRKVGYQGVWLYELDFSAPKSIIRPRDLTCEDFRQNAEELFAGKDLTTISTPVENLGFWV